MNGHGVSKSLFIVDLMLGSLAKWLRMAGYDAVYDKDLEDEEILRLAREEGRTVITRDRELARKAEGFLVPSKNLEEQLLSVKIEFDLRFNSDEIRCPVCNGELAEASAESVRDEIPEKSLRNSGEFWRCRDCGKIYWNGTHWDKILERFKKLKMMESE